MIYSRRILEETIERIGLLPFFSNNIPGFSVEEMTEPGLLFGGNEFDGAWEWKGPVIRSINAAYGKFFRRKTGFVSAEALPDFLNYRRHAYPLAEGSTEELILEVISNCDGITSTELRREIFGTPQRSRKADMPVDLVSGKDKASRGSLETPLQRLQMSGRIIISDFEYKHTRSGERYGWGIARFATPESVYGRGVARPARTPASSFAMIVKRLSEQLPDISLHQIRRLLV